MRASRSRRDERRTPSHPTTPLTYRDAFAYVTCWIEAEIPTPTEREAIKVAIHDYYDGSAAELTRRPWCGIRVAEVSFHDERGGGSYMQVDAPWGIAVCGQVERCILALIEAWNDSAAPSFETDEEFERLRDLLRRDSQGTECRAPSQSPGQVLRVVIDHGTSVELGRAVRAEYLDEQDAQAVFQDSSVVIARLRSGLAYHDRFGEEDIWLIPATAICHPTSDDPDDSVAERIGRSILDWAGLAPECGEQAQIERFADAIGHSSIPDACSAIASGLADHPS